MTELQQELFEQQLVSIAKGLEYPRTPNIVGPVMKRLRSSTPSRFVSRRFAWSLTVIAILFASLMLIPPARAAILEFIQIGIVRIFRAEPTPVTPAQQEFPSSSITVTAAPTIIAEPIIPVLERLAGERSLAGAQEMVEYPILIPTYPLNLGVPDHVFVQDADGNMTILVWIDPEHPTEVLMSLHLIPPGSWAVDKMNPARVQETTVNGNPGVWAVGPYPVRFSNGDMDFVRLIDGHVLIWTDGEVTYRLETSLTLEEAVKTAESLEPIP